MKHDTDLQAVLDKGKALLDKGDVAGYWDLLSRHSGYARLAGDVASGDGLMARHVPYFLQADDPEPPRPWVRTLVRGSLVFHSKTSPAQESGAWANNTLSEQHSRQLRL